MIKRIALCISIFSSISSLYCMEQSEEIKNYNDLVDLRVAVINYDPFTIGYICGENPKILRHNDRYSPLCLATRFNARQIASFFLFHGANPNAEGIDGLPIHHACIFRDMLTLNLLRNFNVQMTKNESYGNNTPLHTLIKSRMFNHLTQAQIDITHLLLDNGNDPNQQNNEGHTPLHELLIYAKEFNIVIHEHQLDLCKHLADLLLQAKANIHTPNLKGKTPLMMALELHLELAAYIQWRYEVITQSVDSFLCLENTFITPALPADFQGKTR